LPQPQQQHQHIGAETDPASAIAPVQQPQQPSSQQQQQQQDALLQQQIDNPLLAAAASSNTRVTTAVLGSLPGVLWHVRRRYEGVHGNWPEQPNGSSSNSASDAGWSVQQYAAAAILSALDPTASMEEAGLPAAAAAAAFGAQPDTSATATAAAAEESMVAPDPLEQQQQDEAELVQLQQQQQLLQVPADFSLIQERVASHAAASTSGRDSPPASNSSSSSQPALSVVQQQDLQNAFDAGLSADELLLMQQGPAANFRDPRFEQALSRWIKEAPDWFKVRSVSWA
jgi:hypothetical protein